MRYGAWRNVDRWKDLRLKEGMFDIAYFDISILLHTPE